MMIRSQLKVEDFKQAESGAWQAVIECYTQELPIVQAYDSSGLQLVLDIRYEDRKLVVRTHTAMAMNVILFWGG